MRFELALLSPDQDDTTIMNWYYIDGPRRVGPLNETEWAELLRTGKIQPETLVWHEGMDKWTPYSQVPPSEEEEAEIPVLDAVFETTVPEAPEVFAARVADLDYPVQINHCISRGWGVLKAHFSKLVSATFVLLAIGFLIAKTAASLSVLEIAVLVAFQGVLMGGFYDLCLRCLRGEPSTLATLFSGFQATLLKPLALRSIVGYLVSELCFFALGDRHVDARVRHHKIGRGFACGES